MNFCLYHENCFDGMAAAWAVWRARPDWTFIPVNYGQAPPDLENIAAGEQQGVEQVAIVDFSYPAEILRELAEVADHVLVLDHHKTAQEDLESFEHPDVSIVFDMDRSGAMLAWDHFHPHASPYKVIEYVQDRDLWRWQLEDTREVNAWLRTHELGDMETFNAAAVKLQTYEGYQGAVAAGKAILIAQQQAVEIAKGSVQYLTVAGHGRIPVVNSCLYQSEIGSELARTHPFSLVWYLDRDGMVRHSLRSTDEGLDVGRIARIWGGGGHRKAAGFISKPHDSPVLG